MSHLVSNGVSAVGAFAVTNVDDFVVLTALFATVRTRGPTPRQIVFGQYLGIGALVAVSVVGAIGLLLFPEHWVGLLGLVPLALGVRGLFRIRRLSPFADRQAVPSVSRLAGVVAVTVANGADNISVYTPLFRQAGSGGTGVYVIVFALLVACWCLAGSALATRPPLISIVRRVGHWLVPVIYIGIGLRIVLASGLLTD